MAIERDYTPVYVNAGDRIGIPIRSGNETLIWETTVAKACDNDSGGYWWCEACQKTASHNMEMHSHAQKGHRLAWICFEHGPETVNEAERPTD